MSGGFRIVSLAALIVLYASPGHAQLARTWVSAFGSDANDCSRAHPCRNFSAALNKVAANGDVVALDAGDYAAFTINKSVRIITAGGARPIVSGSTGPYQGADQFSDAAIRVNPGANGAVSLDGLIVSAAGGSKGGIWVGSGSNIQISNVDILGSLANGGIRISIPQPQFSSLRVSNVNILCGACNSTSPGFGFHANLASPSGEVSIDRLFVANYRDGASFGAPPQGTVGIQITNSRFEGAGNKSGSGGSGVVAMGTGGRSKLFLANSIVTNSDTGVLLRDNSEGIIDNVIVTNCHLSAWGVIRGYGNSKLDGNELGQRPGNPPPALVQY